MTVVSKYPNIIFGQIDRDTEDTHLATIEEVLDSVDAKDKNAKKEIAELRKNFYGADRETRINTLSEINTIERANSDRGRAARQLKDSPYFSRLDFESGTNKNELYISKGPIKDVVPDHNDVRYINWRAPIADLYYRYGNRPFRNASYISPDGKKTGDIPLVARIKIENGEIKDIFANSIDGSRNISSSKNSNSNIESDDLQQKLASNSTDKMTEIVETIQSEQNEIIRHEANSNIIIQGAAGSGKTAIALHRVAYLLYDQLKDSEILFVSPNKAFSDYISEVLPELGEVNIPIKTMDEIYSDVFGETNAPESLYSAIEEYFEKGKFDGPTRNLFIDDNKMRRSLDQVISAASFLRKKIDAFDEAATELNTIIDPENELYAKYDDIRIKNNNLFPISSENMLSIPEADKLWNKYSIIKEHTTDDDGRMHMETVYQPTISKTHNIDFVFYAITDTILNRKSYKNKILELNYTQKRFN